MKELATEEQERQLRYPLSDDWGPIGPDGMEYSEYLHNPTSFMEIQYEELVDKLMGNYHRLTNEQIETINRIAKYL